MKAVIAAAMLIGVTGCVVLPVEYDERPRGSYYYDKAPHYYHYRPYPHYRYRPYPHYRYYYRYHDRY